MGSASRVTHRIQVYSWSHGGHYNASPSDGNITVVSTWHRGSGYSLKVDGQSGVSSTVSVTTPGGGQTVRFVRAYFNFITIPSASRVFWSTSSVIGANVVNLRMKSDGHIEIRLNAAVIGTSLSALTTGRAYRIEIGHAQTSGLIKLMIDGAVEIDWTTISASADLFGGQVYGAIDTVASAMAFYVADVALDLLDFPGYGKTALCKMTAVARDGVGWVNTGGAVDKVAAVDPNPSGSGFNDTTYLLSSTSGQEMAFTYTIPSKALVVWGVSSWARFIRNGASNATFYPSVCILRAGTFQSDSSSSLDQTVAGATRSAATFQNWARVSTFGPWWPPEFYGTNAVGLLTLDANGLQLSAYWVEVDYSDVADEQQASWVCEMHDFEFSAPSTEILGTNITIGGTLTTDATRSKFGGQSLRMPHSSGGNTSYRYPHNTWQDINGSSRTPRMTYVQAWIYIETPQSSGDLQLFYWLDNTTDRGGIAVNAAGGVKGRFGATNSAASANGTVPFGQWFHMAYEYLSASSTVASDARIKVWVNDVLVLNVTGTSGSSGFGLTFFFGVGSRLAVTGGAVVWYDGYIHDFAVRHGKDLKFKTIHPDSAGSVTTAGYTVVGAANKWDAVDDVPSDDDTSYVLLATGLGTATNETYNLNTATGPYHVNYAFAVFATKRDAATNGSIDVGVRLTKNAKTQTTLSSVTPGAAYGNTRLRLRTMPSPFGKIDNASIDDLEAQIGQRSNTVASRVSMIAIVVAYKSVTNYAPGARKQVMAIG